MLEDPSLPNQLTAATRCAHLATVPDAGTNVALVSHSAFAGDVGGVANLDPALCARLDNTGRSSGHIYKPQGDGGSVLILTDVTADGWASMP